MKFLGFAQICFSGRKIHFSREIRYCTLQILSSKNKNSLNTKIVWRFYFQILTIPFMDFYACSWF